MSPSPNRSSKSPKSSKAQSAQPSEQAVNPLTQEPAIAETTGEKGIESEPATSPTEPPSPPTVPENLAPVERLQRPRQAPIPTEQPLSKDKVVSEETPPPPPETARPEGVAVPSDAPSEAGVWDDSADPGEEPDTEAIAASRQQPISPPSEPRQYRAVGLVRGRYSPTDEQFTRGMLLASDGTAIDAVLLGRVMSLVKNHLDLEQEHLWVVYPRTRQQDGNLHTQIMGVWEPETLCKQDEEGELDDPDSSTEETLDPASLIASLSVDDGYFSIRGEVIYQSQEDEKYVIVKIKQSPRKDGDKTKFFKLKLKGALADKAVGHFWDFHAQLQGNVLVIQEGNDIGSLPIKKNKFKPGGGGGGRGKRPFPSRGSDFQRPSRPNFKPAVGGPPVRKESVPKPVKRSKPDEG